MIAPLVVFIIVVVVNVVVLLFDWWLKATGQKTITEYVWDGHIWLGWLLVGWQVVGAVALWLHFFRVRRHKDE